MSGALCWLKLSLCRQEAPAILLHAKFVISPSEQGGGLTPW